MNPQETQQVIAHDEKWVPSTERVKISPTNVRLKTIVHKKEETFQVIINVIKNSTCFKAFTISSEIPEIFMQQFWYTIKKVKDTESYESLLANKKCIVNAEVFRKILDICPRVEGEEFTEVQDDDTTLTFLIDLGYKGPLHKHTRMENVNYPELIWEDFVSQIDLRREKKSRRETMPFPRFTKDDGIISKLKFVRIGEDYQEYGLPILDIMLNDKIKQSDSYQMFLKYSTGLIPPKKSRGKVSKGKKIADVSQESFDVSDESKHEPAMKKSSSRSTRGVVIQDTPKQEALNTMQALKESKKTSKRQPGTRGSSEGTGRIPGVPNESTIVSATSSEGTENESEHSEDSQLNSDEEEKKDNDGDANDGDEDDDHISDIQDTDDEDAETESDEDEIFKYKIQVHKDVDVEMVKAETVERENKEKDEMTDAAKADVEKTAEERGDTELAGNTMTSNYQVKESTKFPLPSSSLTVSSGFGTHFLNLSSDVSLTVLKVPVSVISETTTLLPIPEFPTKTLVSTALSPPYVIPTISIVQQTTTPIPTPSITTKAPTITTTIHEFDALTRHTADLIQKYSVKPTPELRKIQKLTIYLAPESEKSASEIHKIKKE
ncbi:hypothetical protein Tco_0337788 [Tanacetum coccineum]